MIFDQNWRIASDETGDDNSDGTNHSSEDDSANDPVMRKSWFDLTQIFPSKRCISMYLEDAYLPNFEICRKPSNEQRRQCSNLITEESYLYQWIAS
jgi:hypothetical protein